MRLKWKCLWEVDNGSVGGGGRRWEVAESRPRKYPSFIRWCKLETNDSIAVKNGQDGWGLKSNGSGSGQLNFFY